jgi:hypothetical protein
MDSNMGHLCEQRDLGLAGIHSHIFSFTVPANPSHIPCRTVALALWCLE